MSIRIKEKQFFIDGKSTIIIGAEFHYYRTDVSLWKNNIELIKQSGCNTIATYVPWVLHEFHEGVFDFDGTTKDVLNFKLFLKLVKEAGLYLVVRPGPFVMAEMLNDGIPKWVSEKYPDTVPITWDNNKGTTVTLDYTNENFLKASKEWYREFVNVIKEYAYPKGNLIGFQLDNEVGMLSWVSNCPDLTDTVLVKFSEYLQKVYSSNDIDLIYGFDVTNLEELRKNVRTPNDKYVLNLQQDLGEYMRERHVEYFKTLEGYTKEFGLEGVPFIINIHGCGGGLAHTYPVGISQLYKAWQGNDYISSSDSYLDNVDVPRFVHYYLVNALTDATNGDHQPLSALEFSCGDGNYGNNYGMRFNDSRIDAMIKLFMAQGNKLINNYIFTGGYNYRVNEDLGNGTDIIANTSEEHGYAAPISADGEVRWSYHRTKQVITGVMNVSEKLASSFEETSNVVYGFVPNYFMTEFHYPKSEKNIKYKHELERNRAHWHWDTFVKLMFPIGCNFKAKNIQDQEIPNDKIVIIPSTLYMEEQLQEKIVKFLNDGGKAVVIGYVPKYGLKGNDCKILYNALGIEDDKIVKSDSWTIRVAVQTKGILGDYPDHFTQDAHLLKLPKGAHKIMGVYKQPEEYACGFIGEVGKGKVAVIAANKSANIEFVDNLMKYLGAKPVAKTSKPEIDVVVLPTTNDQGETFIYAFNLNDTDKTVDIEYKGEMIFKDYILLSGQSVMLPLNIRFNGLDLEIANNEIYNYNDESITFRYGTSSFNARLKTSKIVTCDDPDMKIEVNGEYVTLSKDYRKYHEDYIVIKFK